MVIRINDAARNAAANAIVAEFSAGTGAPVLRIYTGAQPATPATAPGAATLLAEFTLDDPAFAAAAGGSAALDVAPALTDDGLAAGVAGWFRICTSTEAAGTGLGVMDGSVTATGGGGDLTLNTTTISVGVSVEITGGSVTMPAAA
jgi:hypothetical protein